MYVFYSCSIANSLAGVLGQCAALVHLDLRMLVYEALRSRP